MAMRKPDGTVTLQEANEHARKADRVAREKKDTARKMAQAAVDSVFKSPLDERRDAPRAQKPVRARITGA